MQEVAWIIDEAVSLATNFREGAGKGVLSVIGELKVRAGCWPRESRRGESSK